MLKLQYMIYCSKKLKLMTVLSLVNYFKNLTTMQKLKRLRKIPNHNKYVTTTDIDNCSGAIFDERSKQASLATKSQA